MYLLNVNHSVTSDNPMDYIVHGILQARIREWVFTEITKQVG